MCLVMVNSLFNTKIYEIVYLRNYYMDIYYKIENFFETY